MKTKMTKLSALALAFTMGFSTVAFAATASNSGTISSKFSLYSPTLTVTVPASADVQVNPLMTTTTSNGTVDEFEVASKALIFTNKTIDTDPTDSTKKKPIPLTVTVTAKAVPGEGVVTHYNNGVGYFESNATSTKKEIFLQMSTGTAKVDDTDSSSKLDDKKVTAKGFGTTKATPVTSYGSKLQFNVAGPTLDTSTSTTVEQLGAGACAITGDANYNADWAEKDLTVTVTYSIKASTYTGAPEGNVTAVSASKGADATFTLTKGNLEGAELSDIAFHNNGKDGYGDIILDKADYTAETKANGDIEVTFAGDGTIAGILGGDSFIDKPQDVVFALSDGRMFVSSLTYES